jgi:hypothetical protein
MDYHTKVYFEVSGKLEDPQKLVEIRDACATCEASRENHPASIICEVLREGPELKNIDVLE